MKISGVEIFNVKKTDKIGGNFNAVIVRVNTDEGVSGLGEFSLGYTLGGSAAIGMIKELSERFFIGADPMKIEKIWGEIFKRSYWAKGGGPIIYGSVSALDIALWDIKGKVFNAPLYQLLGGKTRDKLRTYASQIHFGWSGNPKPPQTPEEYGEEAVKAVAQGFSAVKVDPVVFDDKGKTLGWDLINPVRKDALNTISKRMSAIRRAIGPNIDIIIDVHAVLGTATAIQIGKVLEEFDCLYFEEPIHLLNVDAMAKVSQNVKIPLAAGERIYTRWGYREFFEKQILGVVQPDLGLVGGISEGKKVCDYASVYDIGVQCHICGSPVLTACSLHLEAAISNFVIHEYLAHSMNPENYGLIKQNLQPKDGFFEIPDAPGLGIDLDEKVISKYQCIKVN